MQPRLRGKMKSKGRYGMGVCSGGASTRFLTRVMTYLLEVGEANLTKISRDCIMNKERSVRDALQWLLSNKIILKKGTIEHNNKSHQKVTVYYMNPLFIEIKKTQSHGSGNGGKNGS